MKFTLKRRIARQTQGNELTLKDVNRGTVHKHEQTKVRLPKRLAKETNSICTKNYAAIRHVLYKYCQSGKRQKALCKKAEHKQMQ